MSATYMWLFCVVICLFNGLFWWDKTIPSALVLQRLLSTKSVLKTWISRQLTNVCLFVCLFRRLLWYPGNNHPISKVDAESDVFVNLARWFFEHTQKWIDAQFSLWTGIIYIRLIFLKLTQLVTFDFTNYTTYPGNSCDFHLRPSWERHGSVLDLKSQTSSHPDI